MAIKLKLELKWTKIKRVVTIPRGLNLEDLNNVIQAMFGFEHDHLWNFSNKAGKVWDTGCTPLGDPLDMDMQGVLDPYEFSVEDVLVDSKEKLLYSYDYGDGWKIVVSRMADSKDDEIACVEMVGTNAMEDIGGVGGLEEFTELLKNCKIKSEDEITDDTDWRISEWGYDDPAERAAFLKGPTLEELTKKLREEVGASIEAREERAGEAEKEKMFRNVGRNAPCPCGSGKKFKKCCGASSQWSVPTVF